MKNLFRNWNIMRIFRLVLGLAIVGQGIQNMDWTLIIIGGLLTLMPVFNYGCCSTGRCNLPMPNKKQKPDEVRFEEVK